MNRNVTRPGRDPGRPLVAEAPKPVNALAVMDAQINAAKLAAWNAETEPRAARHEKEAAELADARAAFVHLMAAAESVTTNPDMTTVRGRQEMTRRLDHLCAVLKRCKVSP